MKKYLLLIIFHLSLITFSDAQNPLVKQWDKRFGGTYSDYFNSFQQTKDGGYILVGYSLSGIGGNKTQANWGFNDYWIVKIDSLGNIEWDKDFGGTDDDEPLSLQQTADGGYIFGGYSSSNISGDKSQNTWGSYDYWIVKIDSLGIKQWDKDFGGYSADILNSLQQTSDKGYILGGFSLSGISGDKTQPNRDTVCIPYCTTDYWIIKIDSLGNKQWDRNFGGTNEDELYSLQQTADGGYILGGFSDSGISGDKTQNTWGGYRDYWIVKIDSFGNKEWDKDFGGTSIDQFTCLHQTNDRGYILGGWSYSGISGDKTESNWDPSGGYPDYWVIKIDSSGNKQWDKDFGGTGYDQLYSLQQTRDNGYILGGWSNSGISGNKTQDTIGGADYWIVKIDSSGNKIWDKDFGGTNYEDGIGNISQTPDGGYLIPGTSYSSISGDKTEANLGTEQTWIIKIDSLGNKEWDKTLQTNTNWDDEIGYAIRAQDGCFVFANYTRGAVGGDKTQPNWDTTNTSEDYWIIKFCDTTSQVPIVSLGSSDTTMCEKQCINFFDLSQNAPTSWQWYFPGASPDTSTQQNPTNICYNLYGNYNVTLVACNAAGCDSVFFPAFINVLPTPPAPVITVSNDTLFASGPYSFAWYEVSNPAVVLGTDSFFVFTTGSYYVVATDSNGCNVVSNVVNTGLNSPLERGWECVITPNPASNELTITYAQYDKATINIMNTLGETVLSFELRASSNKLNISALPDGIYFLQLNSPSQHFKSKFVVQR